MLHSIIILSAMFFVTAGISYAITRPIGDNRRYIAVILLSAGLGIIAGFVVSDMVVALCSALAGAFIGMMIAWRRRNPAAEPPREPDKVRRSSSRRPHYGISRG